MESAPIILPTEMTEGLEGPIVIENDLDAGQVCGEGRWLAIGVGRQAHSRVYLSADSSAALRISVSRIESARSAAFLLARTSRLSADLQCGQGGSGKGCGSRSRHRRRQEGFASEELRLTSGRGVRFVYHESPVNLRG